MQITTKLFRLLLLVTVLFVISSSSCLVIDATYSKLPPGPWRGILKLDPGKALIDQMRRETGVSQLIEFDEVTEGDLPFNFEVIYINDDSLVIDVHNGSETIRLNEISFHHDRATNKDTVKIMFTPYDSYLVALFEDNVMEGEWVVPTRGETYRVGFVAYHGQDHRFTRLQKAPVANLTGTWSATFGIETDEPYAAVGTFQQQGNHLEGTFETETGDYRFLEGSVQANKLYLSAFDGSHMYLFEAKIINKDSLEGIHRNGTHFLTTWTARRSNQAVLLAPDSITTLVDSNLPISFRFPDENGNMVSLDDAAFSGKPKIIQLMGTWCPNCLDETGFLIDWYQDSDQNIPIIGLAYERHHDQKKATNAIQRFRQRMKVPYPILLAGTDEKQDASADFPMLSRVNAYPTLLFLDEDNEIIRIHTGFNGPATPNYQEFVNSFEKTVELMRVAEAN